MSAIKFVNEENKISYDTSVSLENIIYYIYNECKTSFDSVRPGHAIGDFVGCSAFFGTSEQMLMPEYVVSQMLANNQAYGKMEGNLIKHRIISFDESDCVKPYEALGLAQYIANAYGEKYITAFGIHLDSKNIHIHLAIDTISWIDGKRFSVGFERNWLYSMIKTWENAREKRFAANEAEWDKCLKYYGET